MYWCQVRGWILGNNPFCLKNFYGGQPQATSHQPPTPGSNSTLIAAHQEQGWILRQNGQFSRTLLRKPFESECRAIGISELLLPFQRNASFFNKITAKELWKGVVSVSNAGKKRGRGRGTDRKGVKNLNIGQKIGFGPENISWPGLTNSVRVQNTLSNIEKMESVKPSEVPSFKKKTIFISMHPLERGWSGRSWLGRSLGPPDGDENVSYDNFDSIVIENKIRANMIAVLGRKRKFTAIVLVGNGKGLIGLGKGEALDNRAALAQAKNKAVKQLLSFDFTNDFSVNHDFFCQFGHTKIFVFKKPEGYGLKCHRILNVCCKLLGIKNMAAKVEGPSNTLNLVKAFLIGLLKQKTPQQIADDNSLHLVEFRRECLNFPNVLASPEKCLTPNEAVEKNANYEEYIWGGKVIYDRPPPIPFIMRLPSWERHLKKTMHMRNFAEVRTHLREKYGKVISHLTDAYPECRIQFKRKQSSSQD